MNKNNIPDHYDEKDLYSSLKDELLSGGNKLRGKFPPISERKNGKNKILKIKKIYQLNEQLRNFYLFIVKNYEKTPKKRYFLAIILAGQSSDFLVYLAKDYSLKHNLKLIQYCVHQKTFRVSLLALKEILTPSDIDNSINSLNEFRNIFREEINKISQINTQ